MSRTFLLLAVFFCFFSEPISASPVDVENVVNEARDLSKDILQVSLQITDLLKKLSPKYFYFSPFPNMHKGDGIFLIPENSPEDWKPSDDAINTTPKCDNQNTLRHKSASNNGRLSIDDLICKKPDSQRNEPKCLNSKEGLQGKIRGIYSIGLCLVIISESKKFYIFHKNLNEHKRNICNYNGSVFAMFKKKGFSVDKNNLEEDFF